MLAQVQTAAAKMKSDAVIEVGEMKHKLQEDRTVLEQEKVAMESTNTHFSEKEDSPQERRGALLSFEFSL